MRDPCCIVFTTRGFLTFHITIYVFGIRLISFAYIVKPISKICLLRSSMFHTRKKEFYLLVYN